MIAETSPIENSRPMIAPITRGDALALTGCFHARQLAATSTLLRVRPARTMPKRPASVAIQRVLFGWLRAVLICDARLPVMPASSISSSPTIDERNPKTPTAKSNRGTKNRNRRKAMALPTTVPALSRSRW